MKYLVKFKFSYYHPDYFDPNKEWDSERDYEVNSTLVVKYEPLQDQPFFDDFYFIPSSIPIYYIHVEKIYEVSWENEKGYTKDCIEVETGEWFDEGGGEYVRIKLNYRFKREMSCNMTHPIPIVE